ncbi:MAG: 4'-phosphopantetheinyl transferase superfamily protein [Kofleriaceae bacterium]|nr:4'-phosphopantetheinyl transferase superfamily protein [Kofleriaceae bacterium]
MTALQHQQDQPGYGVVEPVGSALTSAVMPSLAALPGQALRAGIDVVRVSEIAASLAQFGAAFAKRLFTDAEIAYAQTGGDATIVAARFAVRFAAREAAIKAFGLTEAGVNWCELEVVRNPDGRCELVPHGRARDAIGPLLQCVLSMSHEGDYATAIVLAMVAV